MEFRDYVAAGSLVVALGGFVFNWASARGWAQKTSYRDELARFEGDQSTVSVFSAEAREVAKRAGAYLSLELAERARRQAAKRAKRATQFWRRVITAGVLSVATATLLVVAAVQPRGSSLDPFGDVVIKAYLWIMAASVLLAGLGYFVDLRRLRKATKNLQTFFSDVASSKRLDAIDALSKDEQNAINNDAPPADPPRRFWALPWLDKRKSST